MHRAKTFFFFFIFTVYLNTKQTAKQIWYKVFNVKAALPVIDLYKLNTFLHISLTFQFSLKCSYDNLAAFLTYVLPITKVQSKNDLLSVCFIEGNSFMAKIRKALQKVE